MAFPGELNIKYYKGDTYEFKIYPQKTDGTLYNLSDYSNATFTIAKVRGAAGVADQIVGHAQISTDGTHILCAITPENGALMEVETTYVHDVQIYSPGPGTYDKVFTVVTGEIYVSEDVTQGIGSTNKYIPTYKVIYHNTNATSGQVPVDTNSYSINSNIIVSNQGTLARNGFTFAGWTMTIDSTGDVYLPGDSVLLVSSDIKFYPKWIAE